MGYRTLEKSFYADATSSRYANLDALHRSRLEDPSTIRTGIELDGGELFCCIPLELTLASERIFQNERRTLELWAGLPHAAQGEFIRSLILDEVVSSNEIEGVHSTRRQIELALEAGSARKGRHEAFFEFAKLYLGLAKGSVPPSCPADVRVVFDAVVDGSLAASDKPDGKLFRAGPVLIEDHRGKKLHEGVVPEEKIIALVQQMLELNERDDIPTVFAAALAHFLFGYIHPFYDGNGRVGRYLLALNLAGSLSQPTVLLLSRTIAENKSAYYKGFDAAERPLNRCDATPFAIMLFGLIEQAQEGVITDLELKDAQMGALDERISHFCVDLSSAQLSALRYAAQMHLFEAFGETTLTGLAEFLGVSKATASKSLNALVGLGLLKKVSSRPFVCVLSGQTAEALGLEGR